jgi:glycosyltransferase involved in cell wall biosynthesis
MKGKIFFITLIVSILGFIYWKEKSKGLEEELSSIQEKPIAILLKSENDAQWVERTLESIFEQEYENYRLVYLDDGSDDDSFNIVNQFIQEHQQQSRSILLQHSVPLGVEACNQRLLAQCDEEEIALVLDAKNWFTTPQSLEQVNLALNLSKEMVFSGVSYPSYKKKRFALRTGIASLLRNPPSLFQSFLNYWPIRKESRPIAFINETVEK